MKIISPSYKRAGKIKTVNIFNEHLIIGIHKFEYDLYKSNYPDNELLIIPDDCMGNMAKVRNYIKNIDKYVVMLDDDLLKIGYHENGETIYPDLEYLLYFLENGFRMSEELGTILWGVNLMTDPFSYREAAPFSFLSPVLGSFCCHINSDIIYNEDLGLNEDYDYYLQVVRKYRKILRFNKWHYMAEHIKTSGGCASYRTMDEERKQSEIMEKRWGKIIRYDFNKGIHPIISKPLKGI